MKTQPADININGELGFYSIHAETKRGIKWMRQVQGFDGHVTHSDDTRMTQDIADGALSDGLQVLVNGRRYLGNNRSATQPSGEVN